MVSNDVSLLTRVWQVTRHVSGLGAAFGLALLAPASANAAPTSHASHATTASTHHASSHPAEHASTRAARGKKGQAPATKHASKREPAKEAVKEIAKDAPKDNGDAEDVVQDIRDKSGAKEPPKPSLTPLPTIAAAMGAPLAMPITTDVDHAKKENDAEAKGHGREPRRSPVLISTRGASNGSSASSPLGASKKTAQKPPCMRDAIDVMRGAEEERVTLTKCDGSVAPLAVESLSILTRPGSAAKPAAPTSELAKKSGSEIAPGIRRIDARLVERLQTMIDHFAPAKGAAAPKVFVVSGYRPASAGSFHANGRALDFRIEGVKNEELVAFCKTLPDTGCGFYPNSSFVHVDVRDAGAGHVSWIDASGPGESPKYVAAWPPPKSDGDSDLDPAHLLAKLDSELSLLPPPVGESKPDNGSKSDLTAKIHDDAPPAAMLEREVDERDKP
jgi:hypothetical protein